jgi:hypothetical protein
VTARRLKLLLERLPAALPLPGGCLARSAPWAHLRVRVHCNRRARRPQSRELVKQRAAANTSAGLTARLAVSLWSNMAAAAEIGVGLDGRSDRPPAAALRSPDHRSSRPPGWESGKGAARERPSEIAGLIAQVRGRTRGARRVLDRSNAPARRAVHNPSVRPWPLRSTPCRMRASAGLPTGRQLSRRIPSTT